MHTFPLVSLLFYVFIFKIFITETVTASWKRTGERKGGTLNIYNALEQILLSEASVRGIHAVWDKDIRCTYLSAFLLFVKKLHISP